MEPTTTTTASIIMPSPLSLIWAGLFAGAGITGGMYVTRKGGEYVGGVIASFEAEETSPKTKTTVKHKPKAKKPPVKKKNP